MSETDRPDDDLAATRTSIGAGTALKAGSLLAGRYRIGDMLGIGGMGTVYRAHDERLDVDVALKVLRGSAASDRDALERFESELRLARMVTHPNVVRIHDIGEHGEQTFLTMDLVRGRSLAEVISRDGPMSAARAAEIGAAIAEGLAAAHAKGVVHRDLKPANIMVDEDGAAVITDFGVARSILAARMTRTGMFVGTPDYLAPEQASGAEVDGRADIFALGVILFEMVSGRLPFEAASVEEVVAQRTAGRSPNLAELGGDVPSHFKRIIDACLRRNPDERFADANSLAAALRGDTSTLPAGRGVGPQRWLVAVIAIAAVGIALWQFGRGGEAVPGNAGPADSTPVAEAAVQVAVLPFRDEPPDVAIAWVSTGIGESLTVNLDALPGLDLVDRQRVRATLDDLRVPAGPPAGLVAGQLARLLGADWLVSGTVTAAGDKLRVQAVMQPREGLGDSRPLADIEVPLADVPAIGGMLASRVRQTLELPAPEQPPMSLSANLDALRAYALGVDLLNQGDSLGALEHLENAVAADPEFAAAWLSLAESYDALGRSTEADDAIERAVRGSGDDEGVAQRARVRQAQMAGELERARELLQLALQRDPNDGVSRFMLAELTGDAGHFAEAIDMLEEVVDQDPHHPRAWFLLGKFAIQNGDSPRALNEFLGKALSIQDRLGNEQGRADALNAMGIAQVRIGQLEAAHASYTQAADIREQIDDRRGLASSLANLARIELQLGNFDAARAHLDRAIDVRTELSDEFGLAGLYNVYGALEEEQGDYREALRRYRQALKIRRDAGDRGALGNSYNSIGFAYFVLGEYDNAQVYWQLALEESVATDNPDAQMEARQNLGQLALAQGRWGNSLELFLNTLEASRDLGNPYGEVVALGNLGRVAQRQGRYGAALASYRDAVDMAAALDDVRGQIEFGLWHTDALIEMGADKAAQTGLTTIATLLDEIGNEEQRAHLDRMRGVLAARSGETASASDAIRRAREAAERTGSPVPVLQVRVSAAEAGIVPASEWPELAAAAAELGNADLVLRTLMMTLSREIAAGNRPAINQVSDALSQRLEQHAPYAQGWRAHALLAEAMELLQRPQDAAGHRAVSTSEVQRLLADMPQAHKDSFTTSAQLIGTDANGG